MLSITAAAKPVNGRIDGRVEESKILISIKKGGSKVCGSYTSNSALASNFNTSIKVWAGKNAVSLLGQDCTLPPGDYELCVQFFGAGPAGIIPLSEENSKPFSIRENEQQTYQPPQPISPLDKAEIDFNRLIVITWTPVIPMRQNVTYRLNIGN